MSTLIEHFAVEFRRYRDLADKAMAQVPDDALNRVPGPDANSIAMIVRQGLALAVVGLGLGLMLALALNRVVAVLLFAVEPTDPATYAAVSAVVLAVAAVACYVPARRAAGVDPVEAIRN